MLVIFYVSAQTAYTGIRGMTGLEITTEMAPGVNLWNTLDAVCGAPDDLGSETCWGNPFTTHEMIDSIAARGFKTLRIPVTWYNHMGQGPNYIIDTAWMDRVEEVANYAFNNDMYVIINIHHDDYDATKPGSWLSPTYAKQDEVIDQLEKVWVQIATRFKDYGDYLIFETMNEPREVGSDHEWNGGSEENRNVVNAFNLAAVNAIRGTGGNNADRFIMIPQCVANPTAAKDDLIIPNGDTNIIVSVHNYGPFEFCLLNPGVSKWGTTSERNALRNDIMSYYDHWTSKGQAVVLGEWGAANKNNYADRVAYYDVFAKACKDAMVTPISWIYEFNRRNLEWDYPILEDAILSVYDTTTVDVEDLVLNIVQDTLYVNDSVQLIAKIFPDTATYQSIIWTSYNEEVAKVNSAGLVSALSGGRVSITATAIGKTTKCNLIVIDTLTTNHKLEKENLLSFYPNPSNGIITVENGTEYFNFKIYDLAGILVHNEFNIVGKQIFDLNHLSNGMYILNIWNEKEVITVTLIMNK